MYYIVMVEHICHELWPIMWENSHSVVVHVLLNVAHSKDMQSVRIFLLLLCSFEGNKSHIFNFNAVSLSIIVHNFTYHVLFFFPLSLSFLD